jgi:acyl-ACP thioesterase
VDFYGHINNSKYIDFIMDCFSLSSHRQYSLRSIEVNYIKEAFPGDTLVLYRDTSAVDSNMAYIEGINEADGRVSFKAQIEIAPR